MKKLLIAISLVIIGIAIGIIFRQITLTYHYKKVDSYKTIGKVVIINNLINVREKPTTKSKKLFEALKNEEYEVVELFEEETGIYNWYKIVFSERRIGWIASLKETPWIIYTSKEE